jgi:hypothetical protein
MKIEFKTQDFCYDTLFIVYLFFFLKESYLTFIYYSIKKSEHIALTKITSQIHMEMYSNQI